MLDDDNTRTSITRLLVDFWCDRKPEQTLLLQACWQLADKVLDSLPARQANDVCRMPERHQEIIAAALDRLIQDDLIARSLVGTLAQGTRAPSSGPHITVHGDHNQVTLRQQTGSVSQVMYISGERTAQSQASPAAQSGGQAPRITLQLTQRSASHMEVRAIETPTMGEARIDTPLPYTDDELVAVLKALSFYRSDDVKRLTPPQSATLERLGLLSAPGFDRRRLLRMVGQRLYDTLFAGRIGEAFRATLSLPRPRGTAIHLQLCFDTDTVTLARYPWETLYNDGRHLVQGALVALTRYITYPQAIPAFALTQPPHVLYLAPRPPALPYLPADEDLQHMRTALGDLERLGQIQISQLSPPTFRALLTYLSEHPIDILHFDGHGSFARQCPHCRTRNHPHITVCATCHTSLTIIPPEGFLAFEDEKREADWIDSSMLGGVLTNRSLQLALVLACSSGIVRGETVFTGVGPALIGAGVPAVIAAQADIESSSATLFTQGFYRRLVLGADIPTAVNAGRDLLLTEQTWHLPTLYIRSRR
ncbi:CHAT domain-containing protein [Chloroflexales bacterium ZM16-3]|nr:CHAT domain-containing protein [Chloroflexales bacterium ZM16-3]